MKNGHHQTLQVSNLLQHLSMSDHSLIELNAHLHIDLA